MKTKFYIILFTLSFACVPLPAQESVEVGQPPGREEDSMCCLRNISLYKEYMKANRFVEAYPHWRTVFTESPLVEGDIYNNGAQILRALIAESKDPQQKQAYLNELMAVHDQRIRYLDQLNALIPVPVTIEAALGMKIHDYVIFSEDDTDLDKVYAIEKETIASEQQQAPYYMFLDMIELSSRKLKTDTAHKEQFILDYVTVSRYIAEAMKAATGPEEHHLLKMAKDKIDAHFINSGTATCENLQAVYGSQIEQHKYDIEYLKEVISVMQMLKCTNEEAYFAASEALYAAEPTGKTAAECGWIYYRKGNMDKCISYLDEAIKLTLDNNLKAEYSYNAAVALFNQGQPVRAKQYAEQSLLYNSKYGKSYILLAQMYASFPNWSQEDTLNKCTYYAVLDKLQEAQSADPDIAEEAGKLINAYSAHVPNEKDLIFIGLQKGNSVTIGGWIDETTTIR